MQDLQDALNRCLPAAQRAKFGDLLAGLINSVNGLALRMDQQGTAAAAQAVFTVGGTINAGDTFTLIVLNPNIPALASPGVTIGPNTVLSTDNLAGQASDIASMLNGSAPVVAAGITAVASSSIVTTSQTGTIGNSTTFTAALKAGASLTIAIGNGGVAAGGSGTFGTGQTAAFGITPLNQR
jgi:hypothetical protein